MPFADQIILAVINKHILCKQWLSVIGCNAGLEAMVSGLDITISMVNTDNDFVVELFHVLSSLSYNY